jgi:hypothetical protein
MKNDQHGPAAASVWGRYKWLAIVAIALAAIGLAYQFRTQPQALAKAGVANQARPASSAPYSPAASAAENRSSQPQQGASKAQEYCPTGEPGSEGGTGGTLCSLLRGNGGPDGTGILGRIRSVVVTGASQVAPVVRSFAEHCLAYLK